MNGSVVDDAVSVNKLRHAGYVRLLWVRACRGNTKLVKVCELGSGDR